MPGTMSIQDPGYKQWWLDQVAISSGAGLAGYAVFLSQLDARPFLSQIVNVPTFILAPARSAATKLEEQQWIQKQISGAQLQVIDARGHEIYVEEPEECSKAFLQFINSVKR